METEITDLNIPADAAALVVYADGNVALHLPKAGDTDDAPDNAVAVAALATCMLRNPELFQQVLDSLETDMTAVLSKADI